MSKKQCQFDFSMWLPDGTHWSVATKKNLSPTEFIAQAKKYAARLQVAIVNAEVAIAKDEGC